MAQVPFLHTGKDVTEWIADLAADAEVDFASACFEKNASQQARMRAQRDVLIAANAEIECLAPWDRAHELGRFIHREEIRLGASRAGTYENLMAREGTRRGLRQLQHLVS